MGLRGDFSKGIKNRLLKSVEKSYIIKVSEKGSVPSSNGDKALAQIVVLGAF